MYWVASVHCGFIVCACTMWTLLVYGVNLILKTLRQTEQMIPLGILFYSRYINKCIIHSRGFIIDKYLTIVINSCNINIRCIHSNFNYICLNFICFEILSFFNLSFFSVTWFPEYWSKDSNISCRSCFIIKNYILLCVWWCSSKKRQ